MSSCRNGRAQDDESENGTEPSESESESDDELEHWVSVIMTSFWIRTTLKSVLTCKQDAHMEDADGVEGDEVFPNEDEDEHDHDGEEQFEMFDEDGVELIDQENDGQSRHNVSILSTSLCAYALLQKTGMVERKSTWKMIWTRRSIRKGTLHREILIGISLD
jgi:hypothetical protein